MPKEVLNSAEAKDAILAGIDIVANIVKETLGPGGRVILLADRLQTLTKDGVSVARSIQLDGPEGEGAKLCIHVASRANSEVGDGTTTATVLAQALSHWATAQKEAPRLVKAKLDSEAAQAIEFVRSQAKQLDVNSEFLQHIASISGNDPNVGQLVADAWKQIGPAGIITHRVGPRTELNVESGYRLDVGLYGPVFINDSHSAAFVAENAQVVLIEPKTKIGEHMLMLLSKLDKSRPILIVADLEGDALATVAINVKEGKINAGLVKLPALNARAYLDDIAALTGASVIDKSYLTVGDAPLTCVGVCPAVRANQWSTILLTPPCDESYLDQLRAMAESSPDYMRDPIAQRIAKLTSGVAVITCGGATEAEAYELRDRVEDAVRATRAALDQGVVPGAGWCLANCGCIEPFSIPQRTILNNAGLVNKDASKLIDARTGCSVDPFEAGILDPASVVITAIEAATSIAKLVTDCGGMVIDAS